MRKTKKNMLISVFACACVALSSVGAFSVYAETVPTLGEVQIESEYVLGTDLTIPQATFTVGGTEKAAEAIIVFPDGGAYRGDMVKLSQMGDYRIEYSCRVNGKKYTEDVEFSVYNKLFQTNNSIMASATYYESYEIEEYDGSTTTLTGVLVDLPTGAEIQFNDIIDLSNMKKNDPFISFQIMPHVAGQADFKMLYIQLTDVHDPENFVRISYRKRKDSDMAGLCESYILAGASFQPMVGWEEKKEAIHINDSYGCPNRTSFCGYPEIDQQGNCTSKRGNAFTEVSLDYSTKELFTYTQITGTRSLITDLDNSKFYTDMWSGFTTGEAYLTVYAGTYTGVNSAQIFIKDINGVDLSQSKLEDKKAPVLSVDLEGLDGKNLPDAVVGYSYPVFEASALDSFDGVTDVKTYVYYNYESSNRNLCSIKNGRVDIKRSGIYTIIYETKDGSGNVAQQKYTFTAKAETAAMQAAFSSDYEETAKVGSWTQLPTIQVDNYVQSYDVSVSVKKGNETIAVVDNSFLPKSLGNYQVSYTVVDFTGRSKTIDYTVSVVDAEKPVFYDTAIFPKYLISGKAYTFPNLSAYDYASANDGALVSVKKYMTDKNGRVEITNGVFTPTVNNYGDSVLLEYVATNGAGAETVISYSIPCYIVNVGSDLDVTKYFITSGDMSVTSTSSHTNFLTTQNGAGFTFLNALLADDLDMQFVVDAQNNKFGQLDVYITDAENEDIQIKISFVNGGKNALVCVNDSPNKFELASSFNDETLGMSLTFNAYVNTIVTEYNDSITLAVNNTLKGETFNGFPSGKAYLHVEFKDVTGNAGIKIKKICGQPITNVKSDSIRPTIGTIGEYAVQYKINTKLKLLKALAIDVLDPSVTFTMSVRLPDRKTYATDAVTGKLLKDVPVDEYTVNLTEYGEYTLIYKAVDTAGKSIPKNIPIVVFDDMLPEITLGGTIPSSMKLGETITLPNATVNDNLDGEVDLFIYVENPNGVVSMLVGSASATFELKATLKGKYVVKYCAIDEAGNFAINNYEIFVA